MVTVWGDGCKDPANKVWLCEVAMHAGDGMALAMSLYNTGYYRGS